MFKPRTPFEKNYGLKYVFYSKTLDLGLHIKLKPKEWLRSHLFWGHPEADVSWYDVGPLSFYRVGSDYD